MKNDKRIRNHPILKTKDSEEISFYWNKIPLKAIRGEVISSALIANGIDVFGHHHKDGSPQGMFCANGQCAKCMVIANGIAVKSCMVQVTQNMIIESVEGLPELPEVNGNIQFNDIETVSCDVLIIGGGPAGLSAAIEMLKAKLPSSGVNKKIILIDDKNSLGGKLLLQTHKFFGSVEDSYAGTRGIEIAEKLEKELNESSDCNIWLNSTALFVFKDKKVGVLSDGKYKLVAPKIILNTAGAREKFLIFSGNSLPGVYGAGAFQTLVNRDLVKPSDKLFIVGGGNVGLIAGYHAIQAGIEVVGLVEAMPACGGYNVHSDKLKRLGVPIYTSHTVVCAEGKERVERITIAEIDNQFQCIAGTEKTFACDTVLIAVGLESLNEFTEQAVKASVKIYSAGDSEEIAEASSAMFNGKIIGRKIAKDLGAAVEEIPTEWYEKAKMLKKEPGKTYKDLQDKIYKVNEQEEDVFPVIHCFQEIPCNPCTTICPLNSIVIEKDEIMGLPLFKGKCVGCNKCLLICPGLAITLVDYRKDSNNPTVTMPYEIANIPVNKGQTVAAVDIDGNFLDKLPVTDVIINNESKTQLVKIQSPKNIAKRIVSFRVQETDGINKQIKEDFNSSDDNAMACLCERVTVGKVKELIRNGETDINQIKAVLRLGMGPCGGKTCSNLIMKIFREEGVEPKEIVPSTNRPLFVEIPLKHFAGKDD